MFHIRVHHVFVVITLERSGTRDAKSIFDDARVTCHLGSKAPFPELLSMLCTAVDCRMLQAYGRCFFPVHHCLAVMLRLTLALTHCTV